MRTLVCFVLIGCGFCAGTEGSCQRGDRARRRGSSVMREHAGRTLWMLPGRDANLTDTDPCCGLAYDGNRYADSLATCATIDDECGPDRTPVYPGIVGDRVCGERRRCVPPARARLIVRDHTKALAVDFDDQPLPSGADSAAVAHAPVTLGRPGFIKVKVDDKPAQLVTMDYWLALHDLRRRGSHRARYPGLIGAVLRVGHLLVVLASTGWDTS